MKAWSSCDNKAQKGLYKIVIFWSLGPALESFDQMVWALTYSGDFLLRLNKLFVKIEL